MIALLIPIITISLAIYLFLILLGSNILVWISAIFLGVLASYFLLRRDWGAFKDELVELFTLKNTPLFLVALFAVIATAYVASPLVITKSIGNFEHIQITDVGDYYKHTFVVSQLKNDGIPPKNPYFPSGKLSYYFGFYLIPAAASKLFGIFPNWSFYLWSLFSDFIVFIWLIRIISKTIKPLYLKVLAVLLIVFGSGVDLIPFVFNTLGQSQNDQGLQLINNYKALLFVPQHFFAAGLTVYMIYKLLYEKLRLTHFVLISAFIFLCSIFVSITYVFWLGLLFVFQPKLRIFLLKSILPAAAILLPYLLLFSDRSNLFYLNHFSPYPFTGSFFINTLATFWVKYGPMVILLPVAAILAKKFNWSIFLGIFLMLGITWFIRSPVFNDFSMRTSIPIQLVLPILFLSLVQKIKSRIFMWSIVGLSLVVLAISMKGFYLEYSSHWKNHQYLSPKDSELLLKIRSLPDTSSFAAVERDRWVELIPSLAFKQITDPYLYDSYVYLTGKKVGELHSQYETRASSLFLEPSLGPSPKDLVTQKNIQLKGLHQFFNLYPTDQLILSNKLWLKKDTNPWLVILKKMGVSSSALTSSYTSFNYRDLLQKTRQFIAVISFEGQRAYVSDQKVQIPAGLSFLVTCVDKPRMVYIEFEDYYLLANTELKDESTACLGKLFYLDSPENMQLSSGSTVEYLDIFPVEVKPVI